MDGGHHTLMCEVLLPGVLTADAAATTGAKSHAVFQVFHLKISSQTWLPQPAVHEGVPARTGPPTSTLWRANLEVKSEFASLGLK